MTGICKLVFVNFVNLQFETGQNQVRPLDAKDICALICLIFITHVKPALRHVLIFRFFDLDGQLIALPVDFGHPTKLEVGYLWLVAGRYFQYFEGQCHLRLNLVPAGLG